MYKRKAHNMLNQNIANQFLNLNPDLHKTIDNVNALLEKLKSSNPDIECKLTEYINAIMGAKYKILYKSVLASSNDNEKEGQNTTIKDHYQSMFDDLNDECLLVKSDIEQMTNTTINSDEDLKDILCTAFKGTYCKAAEVLMKIITYKKLQTKIEMFKLVYNLK